MKVFFGVLLIIVLILLFPLKIKGKFTYDIFNNYGFVSLFFFSLKLSIFKIKFLPFKIKIKAKGKRFYVTFRDIISENNFGEVFFNTILKVVKIKSIKLFSNFAIKDNAYVSHLTSGLFYVLFGSAFSYFSQVKNFYNVECLNFANFTNTNFVINFTCSTQTNLLMIIICFVISIFKNFKRVREN